MLSDKFIQAVEARYGSEVVAAVLERAASVEAEGDRLLTHYPATDRYNTILLVFQFSTIKDFWHLSRDKILDLIAMLKKAVKQFNVRMVPEIWDEIEADPDIVEQNMLEALDREYSNETGEDEDIIDITDTDDTTDADDASNGEHQ